MISDIFLKMLEPEELKLCSTFPKDYIIDRDENYNPCPKAEQTKRIGNAVVPLMAKVMVTANCSDLKVGERKRTPILITDNYKINGQMAFV